MPRPLLSRAGASLPRDGVLAPPTGRARWSTGRFLILSSVVDEAIARFNSVGLEETLAYYNDPDSVDASGTSS